MQQKTSSLSFQAFGSVYDHPMEARGSDFSIQILHVVAEQNISRLYRFDCEVYLELQDGMAALLVGETPEAANLELFAMHRMVKIKPNIFFAPVAVTSHMICKLIAYSSYTSSVQTLLPPYRFERILPRIQINEILGYYYSLRSSGYSFSGESHAYFELTYVDRGCMSTKVDGVAYSLKERELIVYGPGQFHTQTIPKECSCSYMTILFDLGIETNRFIRETNPSFFESLLNKVFAYDKKIYTLMKTFVEESASSLPYANSLMLCLLQETILRLLQSRFIGEKHTRQITDTRQFYQNELLEKILRYIDESIYSPITIAEICQKFSLSRSSLQILFKENLNSPPKKYIKNLKLEKSRQIICENKYTISEIALMLGFNSVHYFSRAFTQKYGLAPSEYSKMLLKT